jgi:hypothetical protein
MWIFYQNDANNERVPRTNGWKIRYCLGLAQKILDLNQDQDHFDLFDLMRYLMPHTFSKASRKKIKKIIDLFNKD